eukprot:3607204-Prymnesium_polylepis.2
MRPAPAAATLKTCVGCRAGSRKERQPGLATGQCRVSTGRVCVLRVSGRRTRTGHACGDAQTTHT